MVVYPDGYFKKISQISLEYLRKNSIKGLILDLDNTIIDYYEKITEETINWVSKLKQNGIKLYILSNSNKQRKVKDVSKKLGIPYSYFAMKPFKFGFKKAKKYLKLNNMEIAVIGDQIFTDIVGANRMKMFSILVDPIKEKDIFVTLIKRPIENYIKQKYLKNNSSKSN